MDSGLGSDEDRRSGRTKEQKQLRNQQLLSGCFIDASSLSDDAEIQVDQQQRRNDERRQGALIFQSSIPQFSMLQMNNSNIGSNNNNGGGSSSSPPSSNEPNSLQSIPNYPETNTPYNSIIQLDDGHDGEQEQEDDVEEELGVNTTRKSPLGFYVDLKQVPDPQPKTPPSSTASSKKNIFSMVIDFEGPKKDKPVKLSSSSLITYKKNKQTKQLTLTTNKCNNNGNGSSSSLSSSISSISSIAGPSRLIDEDIDKSVVNCSNNNPKNNSDHVLMTSSSSTSSSSSPSSKSSSNENIPLEKIEDNQPASMIDVESHDKDKDDHSNINDKHTIVNINNTNKDASKENNIQERPQFVKLSDLECQKPRIDLNFTPRMSKSIPESSWVESPLLMSRSAGYRSAPHPLEPESGDLSETGSTIDITTTITTAATTTRSHSQPRRSVQRLGTDLLRMFLEEIGPDVCVEVDGHKLKAHKCILASRCQYFAAILSGNWLEASGNVISLQGFSYESVYFALCHIYSGAAHVPDSISLVELASLADMLGLEGLKEVVEHALKQRHCHNFHKPCAGCCTGVLEVLPLAAAYGLDELYQKCLQWITQHFVRVWPSRVFASLPRELREKCYQQHVVHMTSDKVLDTIVACDKIVTTLPALRWAEPVTQLVLQLSDACHLYHRQHFAAVLSSPSFLALDAGLGWSVAQVEDQMLSAASNLSVEQACRSYAKCCIMVEKTWSRPFNDLLYKIKMQLEQCLVSQSDRLIRSNAWLRLDSALRCRIKDLTPITEPVSRLPRATPKRIKKPSPPPPTTTRAKPQQSPTISSSDSSRNSSPGMNQTGRLHNSSGSPSLRRSLLLAARAPQVPPSPSTYRRSTLTQPTQSSAAKSAPSKNLKTTQRNTPPPTKSTTTTTTKSTVQIVNKPTTVKRTSTLATTTSTKTANNTSTVVKRPNTTVLSNRKPTSRSNSPLKVVDSRGSSPRKFDSRVTSPIKNDLRTSSPRKSNGSPKKTRNIDNTKNGKPQESKPVSAMQRSSTFLKDEPTILGKVI